MSDEVHGLKHFTEYFAQLSDQYVIIGGIATNYLLLANDLITRRTKDIVLVVLTNPNQNFADKLRDYVGLGRYRIKSGLSSKNRNYRFRNPK
jgi:phosphoglycolate phosphatase-like HAD superfamily hydrolase